MNESASADVIAAEAHQPALAAQPLLGSRDVVGVGASAGGVSALKALAGAMPADYPGALFVVMHLSPYARSELPAILGRAGALPVSHPEDDTPIRPGHIYIAPPDCHMLVERARIRVVHGPHENRSRPAIDPLFRSLAWAYGPRAVGVVLTGNLDDGTAGLWAIKSCGGTTIVQDPLEAEHPDMPANAMMHNRVDFQLPVVEIAGTLARLARQPVDVSHAPEPPLTLKDEIEFAKMNRDIRTSDKLGILSPFTCPSCQGALWEMEEGGNLRYRCHTGHAYTHASLLADQSVAVEQALYSSLRAVEEKAATLRRLASRWPEKQGRVKQDYEVRARDLDDAANMLRTMLAGDKR